MNSKRPHKDILFLGKSQQGGGGVTWEPQLPCCSVHCHGNRLLAHHLLGHTATSARPALPFSTPPTHLHTPPPPKENRHSPSSPRG
jgi:hypothetical protein